MARPRFRTVPAWITGALALVVTFVLSAYFLRDHLLAPHLKKFLQDSLESRLGIRLAIGGIHGSYLTDLVFTDVSCQAGGEGGAITRLKIARLRTQYRPGSLWKGIDAFVDSMMVSADGTELEIDVSAQAGSAFVPGNEDRPEMSLLPEALPRMQVRGMSAVIRGSDFETRWSGVEMDVRRVDPVSRAVRVAVAEWRWRHPGLRDGTAQVSAEITCTKQGVAAGSVKVNGKEVVEAVRIGLGGPPGSIPVEAKLRLAGGSLALHGDLGQATLHARVTGRGLDASKIAAFLDPEPPSVSGIFSMTGAISFPWLRPGDMEAGLDLQLAHGDILGWKTDRLELVAGARQGTISVDRLRLVSGSDVMEAHAVTFPAESAFSGDLQALFREAKGEFELECRDLPALLRLMGVTLPAEGVTVPEHRIRVQGRVRGGEVEVSRGDLTVAGGGHVHVGSSRVTWPRDMSSMEDAAVQVAVDVHIPDLGVIGRIASLPQLKGSLRGAVNIGGTLGAPSGSAAIRARGLGLADVPLGDISLQADADAREARVRSLRLRRGDDRLSGTGRFRFAEKRVEDAEIEFHAEDLHPYLEMLCPEYRRFLGGKARVGGRVEGHVTASGPLFMPGGSAGLDIRRVYVGGNPWGDATLRLQSTGGAISLREFSIRHGKDRIALSGSLEISSRRAHDVNLEIAVEELARYTRGLFSREHSVNGDFRATLEASGTLEEPEGRMEISLRRLRGPRVELEKAGLTCMSSGRVITIDSAEAQGAHGKGTLSGRLIRGPGDKEFALDISRLVFTGHDTRLDLDGPAQVSLLREGWAVWLRNVSLSGPPGRIRAEGRIAAGGESDLRISVSDLASGEWFDSLFTDRLSFRGLGAEARLSGTRDSPRLDVRGDLAEISARESPGVLSGSFDLSWGSDGIAVREFEWRGTGDRRISLAGNLPLNFFGDPVFLPGPLAAEARLELPDLKGWDELLSGFIPPGGSLSGHLKLGGTWEGPSGSITLRGGGLERPSGLPFLPPGRFDVQCLVRVEGRDAALESLELRAPDLTLTGSGAWTGLPPLPTVFEHGIRQAPGRLALDGHLHSADLGWLSVESPHIRRVSGQLDARVSVSGPASDPAVSGRLRVTGGEFRPELEVPSVQALNLEAEVVPDEVLVRTLSGELGAAPFQVTGSLKRTHQGDIEANLGLRGENLLFYRGEGVKLRADSHLSLTGRLSRLHLAGGVAVTDGYYEKYFDVLSVLKGSRTPSMGGGFQPFSFRTPPLSQATFDVGLTSRQPFRIRNNLIKGTLRPDLRLSGTGQVPVVTGVVYVDETRLALPAGVVVFRSGLIRFDQSRPEAPTLHLIGKSRMGGYDITMVVEGPYDGPTVTLSSVPPLPSEDLLRLVLTGRVPDSRDGEAFSLGAPVSIEDVHPAASSKSPGTTAGASASEGEKLNVAVYVGRDLISRWFGGQYVDTNQSILERFEVDIGRGTTRTGDETIDAQFRLAEGVFREGDSLYITGEKDVFDFYNAGIRIVFRFK